MSPDLSRKTLEEMEYLRGETVLMLKTLLE